jgi:hypothetical protein
MHQTSKRYVVNSPGSANDRKKAGLDDYLTSVAARPEDNKLSRHAAIFMRAAQASDWSPVVVRSAVSLVWVDRARMLRLAPGAQMATHSSWDLGALQPVFRTGNEFRSAGLRMSKEAESGPGFTFDRSGFANPDRSNEHNSRVPCLKQNRAAPRRTLNTGTRENPKRSHGP